LTENKFSKYLLYAIGEIILVVIGILIALQLNTTKEIKTNESQIERILTSVFQDLEKDLINTINFQIEHYENFDSLSKKVLSKMLKASDYNSTNINGNRNYSNLLESQVEPYRFETNAYNRLIENIEIVPEKYIYIVEKLQDVYGDEAIVTNDVLKEEKVFLENIQNRYQNTQEWYSETEENQYDDKVTYLLNDKQHLNDVRRYQKITYHLLQHLIILKQKATYAYNLIYKDLELDLKKSTKIEDIYFPSSEELEAYVGIYKNETLDRELEVKKDENSLLIDDRGMAYKIDEDKFKLINSDNILLEFNRNTNKDVISLSFFVNQRNETSNDSINTFKLLKIK
jgi:hypothetical protein